MSSLQLQGRDVHGTRDTNLASDTQAENTSKGKTSEHPSGFSATDAAREKPSSEIEVSEKGDDEYADFKSGISQEIWLGTQTIISTNFILKKIYKKAFYLKPSLS